MQKQRIILLAGVGLALIVVVLIKVYLDQQKQVASEEARREAARLRASSVAVLIAKDNIPKGTLVKQELLETKVVPSQELMPQAATSLDRISGMVTMVVIPKGQQITLNTLSFPRQAGGLAEVTPVGKRAVTINADNIASLAGMIKPGDYVDMIAMIPVSVQISEGKQATQLASVPLFQNVLVLAVGQDIGTMAQAGAGGRYNKGEGVQQQRQEISSLITIALNPQEASLISFVQEQGKLRLALRSPADSQTQQLKPIGWEALFQYLMPADTAKQPKEEIKPVGYVEIYRGLKKDKVSYPK
ncbi:MAG: Flp pilus assembly protein CpaB [Candidatus Omnitrophota bacterium]